MKMRLRDRIGLTMLPAIVAIANHLPSIFDMKNGGIKLAMIPDTIIGMKRSAVDNGDRDK
jgi:hypothetical protein